MRKQVVTKQRELAKERIKRLFELAEEAFQKNPERSNRYVSLARNIAMKFNVTMPKELKSKFCKHCYSYLKPGINCRVRTRNNKVVYYCFKCKNYRRIPFLREKKLLSK